MFTKIVLVDPNDLDEKFVWLIQLDDGGIAQWFDIIENEEEGYTHMTTSKVYKNPKEDNDQETTKTPMEVYNWVIS